MQRNASGHEFHTTTQLNAHQRCWRGLRVQHEQLCDASHSHRHCSLQRQLQCVGLSPGSHLYGERFHVNLIGEAFNIFNATNILGVGNLNYSGYANTLALDASNPGLSLSFESGFDRRQNLRFRRSARLSSSGETELLTSEGELSSYLPPLHALCERGRWRTICYEMMLRTYSVAWMFDREEQPLAVRFRRISQIAFFILFVWLVARVKFLPCLSGCHPRPQDVGWCHSPE